MRGFRDPSLVGRPDERVRLLLIDADASQDMALGRSRSGPGDGRHVSAGTLGLHDAEVGSLPRSTPDGRCPRRWGRCSTARRSRPIGASATTISGSRSWAATSSDDGPGARHRAWTPRSDEPARRTTRGLGAGRRRRPVRRLRPSSGSAAVRAIGQCPVRGGHTAARLASGRFTDIVDGRRSALPEIGPRCGGRDHVSTAPRRVDPRALLQPDVFARPRAGQRRRAAGYGVIRAVSAARRRAAARGRRRSRAECHHLGIRDPGPRPHRRARGGRLDVRGIADHAAAMALSLGVARQVLSRPRRLTPGRRSRSPSTGCRRDDVRARR